MHTTTTSVYFARAADTTFFISNNEKAGNANSSHCFTIFFLQHAPESDARSVWDVRSDVMLDSVFDG